jgi:hypothetical protein
MEINFAFENKPSILRPRSVPMALEIARDTFRAVTEKLCFLLVRVAWRSITRI